MTLLNEYDYELPAELIAQHPLPTRSDARLMIIDRQRDSVAHHHIRDLPDILRPQDCLVINDTKVIPARLVGYRTNTRGRWSGLFLEADDQGNWRIVGKTRGKLTMGETITLQDRPGRDMFPLRLLARLDGGQWAARPESERSTMELLDDVGRVPLPHYIRGGQMVDADVERYQTVFAEQSGAVAAPTAGLHFTPGLLDDLQQRGVQVAKVTLHVGVGTFRPITSERVEDHTMHGEWGSIDEPVVAKINDCRRRGGRVISIGTTSVRVLETAASDGNLKPWQGTTDIFIRPPFTFNAVDALLTNFHLPKSTLLVLVRTFGGDDLLRRAYAAAIEEQYRFFSYGDAMLIV